MGSFMNEFKHLVIRLEKIKSATNNFDDNQVIGSGGFGKVYKGEISHYKGRSMVAIKRLDRSYGQGEPEFLKEIVMLSRYTHENLISLVGYCDEGHEKILIYEYASNGSLDRHLSATTLTCTQRIKICLDAAKGLSFLHDHKGTQQRILHRDIKSANILLDANWNAKVSDMGLSKIGPANQQRTAIITNVVGTLAYLDPMYLQMGILTKESDVYSFGVVLLEVLCGRLCMDSSKGGNLVHMWKEGYKRTKLDEMISEMFSECLTQQMDRNSLQMLSDLAYQCLKKSHEKRPTMSLVVQKLEMVLESHCTSKTEFNTLLSNGVLLNNGETMFSDLVQKPEMAIESQEKPWLRNYKEILKSAVPPLNCTSKAEFDTLLFKGVLLNNGKTWFSLNGNGQHCEMISLAESTAKYVNKDGWPDWSSSVNNNSGMISSHVHKDRWPDCSNKGRLGSETIWSNFHMVSWPVWSKCNTRFPMPCVVPDNHNFKACVRAEFLSPRTAYIVNLVFTFISQFTQNISTDFKYKLKGEEKTSTVYLPHRREDGWFRAELYQFTSEGESIDLEISFSYCYTRSIAVEGIEFEPLQNAKHKVLEDEKVDMQPISDADWEQKLPNDYPDILKWSNNSVKWTTKKELHSLLCTGFHINNNREWFSLDKNGKKCLMLSAKAITKPLHMKLKRWRRASPKSRFREVAVPIHDWGFRIDRNIESQVLSRETEYATYLVYKFTADRLYEAPLQVFTTDDDDDDDDDDRRHWFIYLVSPQTPVIVNGKVDACNPQHRPKLTGIPQLRSDGWMEVRVWEFKTDTSTETIPMHLEFRAIDKNMYRFKFNWPRIQGVEFRPI